MIDHQACHILRKSEIGLFKIGTGFSVIIFRHLSSASSTCTLSKVQFETDLCPGVDYDVPI